MTPPVLALFAALSWSISHIVVRLGTRSIAPLVGVVLSLASSSIVLVTALSIRGEPRFELAAVGLFVMAGMLGPGLGRILSITAIARIGATRASPVQAGAQPVIGVLLGVFVLSEAVDLPRVLGIALTLSGVMLVVWTNQRGRVAPTLGPDGIDEPVSNPFRVLAWPLAAGTAFALADLVRKNAMQVVDDAFLGGAIGVLVAVTIWGTVLVVRGLGPELWRNVRSPDSRWFMASGAASGAAQVFVLSALRDGDLSLVSPIVSIQPILIAIIARIFLNRLERVGLAVATAAVLATIGTILISI